jgi:hypothetical protein
MNTYDHYAEAKNIADRMEGQGFLEPANEVRCAIVEGGTSATEIFMRLRFYLSPLQRDSRIDPATRAQISVLINKLNEALAP